MSIHPERPVAPSAAEAVVDLAALLAAVNALDGNASDAQLIDRITLLERIKSSCAAAQVRLTHTFTVSQAADSRARQVEPDVARRSIAGQIGLARRDSRHHGSRHLGAAQALMTEMPHTLSALARGDLSERRAVLIIEQFGCLTSADRTRADARLAPEMAVLGNHTAQSRAAAIAYQIDPEAVMGKIRGAVKDRNVTLRPAPDTMSRLSALLPVAQGVAVIAALRAAAVHAASVGDERTRGQVMADHLVAQITGTDLSGCDPYGVPRYGPGAETPTAMATDHPHACSDPDTAPGDKTPSTAVVPIRRPAASGSENPGSHTGGINTGGINTGGVSISLIMTDRTLLGDDDEPAHLQGYGPIPAALARGLIIGQADHPTRTFIRRLYTDPHTGQLAAMDSRQRLFPQAAKDFLLARDHSCRTSWCDAPIRHLDHITPHERGGPTSTANGQGLCEACNHTKQAPGWRSTTKPAGTIRTRTPTGHTYDSDPPPPPKSGAWPDISTIEGKLVQILYTAAKYSLAEQSVAMVCLPTGTVPTRTMTASSWAGYCGDWSAAE